MVSPDPMPLTTSLGLAFDRNYRIAADQLMALSSLPVLTIDNDFLERLVTSTGSMIRS
jgi:hypothetical protein